MRKFMLFLALSSLSIPAFADMQCKVPAGWSLVFRSGKGPKFKDAIQYLKTGELGDATVDLLQIYQSPIEFKARLELDGQPVDVRTSLVSKFGEKEVFSGSLLINDGSMFVTCSNK